MRPEIAPQHDVVDRQLTDAPRFLGCDEQADLGAAEPIDRLHRIADGEQRPPVARLPTRREPANEVELQVGRVLELVDQQMPDPAVEPEEELRGSVRAAQRFERGKRALREVDCAGGAKDQREVGDDLRQDFEQRFDERPRVVGVLGRRQVPGGVQRVGQAIDRGEIAQERPHRLVALGAQRRTGTRPLRPESRPSRSPAT